MKIGILTHPLEANYGGLLQAYALQEIIKRMGCEVEHIDLHIYPKDRGFFKLLLGFIKRNIEHYIMRRNVTTKFRPYITKKDYDKIAKKIRPFITKNIKCSDRFEGIESLYSIRETDYDCIIVGSDQVWIPDFCPEFFLNFTKGWKIKRLSYAASFGHSKWRFSEQLTAQCKEYVNLFDAISVRESSGVDLCANFLGVNSTQVLDPTLLLTASDYNKFIQNKDRDGKILFTYILDYTKEKQSMVDYVSYYLKLSEFSLLTQDGLLTHNSEMPSVETWLSKIKEADFVITDSFHGMVFSIIFGKQFIVIGNKQRGLARFESLLSMLGCSNRLATSLSDVKNIIVNDVDFNAVTARVEKLRVESLYFLKYYLSLN